MRYKDYYLQRNKLKIFRGKLYYEERFVPEPELREEILKRAHLSHNGIRKTHTLVSDLYWWPKLREDVEKIIKNCFVCQKSRRTIVTRKTDLKLGDEYWTPWKKVNIDLAGPFESEKAKYTLVLVDKASKWPEIFLLRKTKSSLIIKS